MHVVALIGIVIASVIVIVARPTRPTAKRALTAVIALVVPACGATVGLHRCDSGQPLQQWLVPSVCVIAVLLWVEPLRLRIALGAICAALAIGLSLHYAAVVHGPTFIGNPTSSALGSARAERQWHTPLTGFHRREEAGRQM